MENNYGSIVSVIGPIVDVRFEKNNLPALLSALHVELNNGGRLVLEVLQHVGDDVVRAVSMGATEGLVRGMKVLNTNSPITVPVGEKTLGRMFNILGEPIDGGENVDDVERHPIHRKAPSFKEQSTSSRILETGIKVIDLLCPYV